MFKKSFIPEGMSESRHRPVKMIRFSNGNSNHTWIPIHGFQ